MTLVVKQLRASDLSWFAVHRESGVTKARQRGLNLDTKVIERLFSAEDTAAETIDVQVHFQSVTGITERESELRPIKLQGKNWRLTGNKIPGDEFAALQPGDYILMHFDTTAQPYALRWQLFGAFMEDPSSKEIYDYLVDNQFTRTSIPPKVKAAIVMVKWRRCSTLFALEGGDETNSIEMEIRESPKGARNSKDKVEAALKNPHIAAMMLSTSMSLSSQAQVEFLEALQQLVEHFDGYLKGRIERIHINQAHHWRSCKGERIGFIDGGVASIESLGNAPLAIRVGCYTVVPGLTGEDRETFDYFPQLVDELFDTSGAETGLFPEVYDDTGKLRDMARISLEAAGALRALGRHDDLKYLFVQGPLVNPVAPYAEAPAFTRRALEIMGLDEVSIRAATGRALSAHQSANHFVAAYRAMLAQLFTSSTSIAGVIERASGSSAVAYHILKEVKEAGYVDEFKASLDLMREYRISDALLFACLLDEGEYITPLAIDKNELRKAPAEWETLIGTYPRPWSTYIRPTAESLPLRIEMNVESSSQQRQLLRMIVHQARLLRRYAFPAGLDIVDKFAKVPAWMSRQVSKDQAILLLRNALATKDRKVIELAKLNLLGNKRDWLFRPRFDL